MAVTYLAGQDRRIAKAEKWVRDTIVRDCGMEELAEAVASGGATSARDHAPVRRRNCPKVDMRNLLTFNPASTDPAWYQAFADALPPRPPERPRPMVISMSWAG